MQTPILRNTPFKRIWAEVTALPKIVSGPSTRYDALLDHAEWLHPLHVGVTHAVVIDAVMWALLVDTRSMLSAKLYFS